MDVTIGNVHGTQTMSQGLLELTSQQPYKAGSLINLILQVMSYSSDLMRNLSKATELQRTKLDPGIALIPEPAHPEHEMSGSQPHLIKHSI